MVAAMALRVSHGDAVNSAVLQNASLGTILDTINHSPVLSLGVMQSAVKI
jgi:hypothetical protein